MDEEKGLRKPVGVERGGAAASTKRVPQRSEDCLSDWTLPPLLARAPVFMFSGQGSQKPGMGGDLLAVKEVKETFSCASDVLGYDVADLVLNADPDELNDTRNAQPALCVLSVGIARALMADPKVLLLDEPSLGLAPLLVRSIFDSVRKINRQGVTVILVEQNARAALKLASRGYVIEVGRVVMEDASEALLANPDVQAAYLGGGQENGQEN